MPNSMHRHRAIICQPSLVVPDQPRVDTQDVLVVRIGKRLVGKVKGLVSDYLFSALIHTESLCVLRGRFHSYFPRGL